MNSIATKTVREVALEIPGATRVFEQLGIDYCCGGQRSLADACSSAGISPTDVEKSLSTIATSHAQWEEPNFNTATLEELATHIINKHHKFTRQEIGRFNTLVEKVYAAHSDNHPELARMKVLVGELSADLEPHMMKEEQILFPYITRMEAAARQHLAIPPSPFGTVGNPIRMMMMEHDRAGEIFKEIRAISSNYTVPADGCLSYQTLYGALAELEKDLHQHIHLENNILFPRAVEMESGTSTLSI
jgi:regulator of cell morphogenesis and NO signaling